MSPTLPRRDLITAGIAALGLSACAPFAERNLVTVNLTDTPPPTPAPGDDGALLETAFDQAKRMTVPVYLEGKGPFQFVVDTGANRSVVSLERAQQLGLKSTGLAPVHGIAGVEPTTMFRVGRLRVGEAFMSGAEFPSLSAAKLGADGLLGVDVLKGRKVTLDFQRNQFEIGPSSLGAVIGPGHDTRLPPLGAQSVTVPARYRFGQLVIVGADVAEVPVAAFLDSGSQITVGNLALRDAVTRARPDLLEKLVETPLISATGQIARGQLVLLPPLRLGGLKVQRLTAVFADLHIFQLWDLQDRPAILIGVDVMRQFESVVLDFVRREVVFRTLSAPRPSRAARSGPGG
jgi:predicted aspartyl protease